MCNGPDQSNSIILLHEDLRHFSSALCCLRCLAASADSCCCATPNILHKHSQSATTRTLTESSYSIVQPSIIHITELFSSGGGDGAELGWDLNIIASAVAEATIWLVVWSFSVDMLDVRFSYRLIESHHKPSSILGYWVKWRPRQTQRTRWTEKMARAGLDKHDLVDATSQLSTAFTEGCGCQRKREDGG